MLQQEKCRRPLGYPRPDSWRYQIILIPLIPCQKLPPFSTGQKQFNPKQLISQETVPNAFIHTPPIPHGLTMHPNSKTKCRQQVVSITLSQLYNVADVGGTAPNTQWHRFYREYKTSRASAMVVASSCESPSYHSCLVVPTLPAPCRYTCSKRSLFFPQASAASSSDLLLLCQTHQVLVASFIWLHEGECPTKSVTCKCNNAFDTNKKKESMDKFSLKHDPTVCFFNSSVYFLASFSLLPTKLHLIVAMVERKDI